MTFVPSQPNIDLSNERPRWSTRFWLLTAATGLAAGLAGGALMALLHTIEHVAWHSSNGNLLEATSRTSPYHRVLMLLAAGIVIGAGGRALGRLVGKSGDLDGAIWFRSGRVPLIPTLARAVHSIVVVGMGTSLGREAAVKQAGGALASRIAEWARLSRPEQRLLVACGVGAGMAAAYNVPVGGALFAVEVLLGSISVRMMMPALLCAGVATTASWVFLPTGPIYEVPEYPLSASLTAWAILVGPLLGVAAVPLIRLLGWADARKPRALGAAITAPIIILTILGFAAVQFPQLLGNGKDVVQLAYADQVGLSLLLLLPLLKLLSTAGCLGSGASGGLFTPTMMIGALVGGALGHLWDHLWPGASLGSCSVIGSCAFLAAATHGPLSALVLVLELTRHIDATMVPMLLATASAVFTVRRLERRSIYTVRLHLGQAELAVDHDRQDPARALASSDGFDVVFAATGFAEIAGLLLSRTAESQRPLYVVDEKGRFVGSITVATAAALQNMPIPLEAAKAADFCDEIKPLTSAMSRTEVSQALRDSKRGILPMVDHASGRLLGIVRAETA